PSVAALPVSQLAPQTIAFADHKDDNLVDKGSGLIRFDDWAQTRLVQKQFLGLFPSYDEPTVTVGTRSHKKRLHMYVAEARFVLNRAPEAIDLTRYATLPFLERIDPAIKHKAITADDVVPNKNPQSANHNPARRWCEGAGVAVCIESTYRLEGKLPLGIALVNKLKENGRKYADTIEFQSELRVVPAAEIDDAGYRKLTGVDSAVVGALEQNIVHVNQVMQFGKFLAVLQRHPTDPGSTIATTFMVLAVDSDLFEKQKKYADVPVLRNLIPAQVLAGNSTFNTGSSISAGLPSYTRNSLKAIAEILQKE
ncbi:MAG TPA: hypothetical protein VGH49_08370, partial [Xanthobacteraceae bacterium]